MSRVANASAIIIVAVLLAVLELAIAFPEWLRDTLRVIELGECVVVLALIASIGRRYWLNYTADPTKARLLPRHVIRLASGVGLLTLASGARVIALVTHPFVWYVTPLTLPAMTIITLGLVDLIVWLPNRSLPPVNAARREDDPPMNPAPVQRVHPSQAPVTRRFVMILFVLVTLFVTWTLWQNEHDSCVRARVTRQTQTEIISATGIRVRTPPVLLACNKIHPDH